MPNAAANAQSGAKPGAIATHIPVFSMRCVGAIAQLWRNGAVQSTRMIPARPEADWMIPDEEEAD